MQPISTGRGWRYVKEVFSPGRRVVFVDGKYLQIFKLRNQLLAGFNAN